MQNLTNWSQPEIVISSSGTTPTLPGLVSWEVRFIFDHIYSVLSAGVVGTFGVVSNIINIIVFYRQGLDNTMNISFFTLAISDLGSVITGQGSSISVNPSLLAADIPFDFLSNQYLITGWPHICFSNITAWITAYITAERCLCIALPLKVKQIITPRVTTTIITVIYLVNLISVVPDFIYTYLDWKWVPSRNESILTLNFRHNMKSLEGVGFIFWGILGTFPFPTVIILTIILVVKLRQQSAWRQKSANAKDSQKAELTSKREIRTMNMVVLIAVVLIICNTPAILVSTMTFIFPSFNISGRYVNIWFLTWCIAFLGHAVSSSVNIFLYYTMSTKYKKTFHELFHCCAPKDLDEQDA